MRTYTEQIVLDRSDPDYDKKVAIHELFREAKSLSQTYEDFAVWLSEPMVREGFDQISRQNINEWFRCKRVPYPDKFRITKLCIEARHSQDIYPKQLKFCNDVLAVLDA